MKKRAGGRPAGWQNCDEARDLSMALDGGFEPDSYEEPERGGVDHGPGISDTAVRAVVEERIDDAITAYVAEMRSTWLDDLKARLEWDSAHGFATPIGHTAWIARLSDRLGYARESVRVMISTRCRNDKEFQELWAGVAKPVGRPSR
ncbi:hypothetical protein [Pinisolibacter aquiterrae]|uniref:hypothetical protein n=1 Tax=Pinisolibacter aquiterrae TaxID=2815579 RepID=UPI001C3C2418|nr:hypothetical protein [Pinisolibacter aquiterrae]MBV5262979.1 hypothetical protein [Pinisolibacter aquiterrae]MCC8235321.1 hypothetical protein [Pinisolibacter aquiterrae]